MAEGPALTIVVNDSAADSFVQLIGERFPQVRAIVAPDLDLLERHIGEADALLASRFPVEVLDQAKKLRWFQCTWTGIDSILPIRHRVAHISVTNARGIQGDIIADYVMFGVAMLHWDVRRLLREQAERKWKPSIVAPLADKTLGVVGLGSIGATIARRAKSAGMTVVGSRRNISLPTEGVDQLFGSDELRDLLPLCDFVVLAVPATPETVGIIGAAEISRMRREAFLINIARGNVVVETDLIRALRAGAIAGAMLDVFEREPLPQDSPLWDMPNVIITPHVSGVPTNYTERVFPIIADNIERFLKGQALRNLVDLGRGY
ncbi:MULTISPECIES: D-2-hydroxyacid dehydrogenase [Bradyrhizobium]|uniref:D-2-hydroxyacid dehydrogenase n=1 Tax=Bradyrhizobium centrosematis TaxID=1300039 RepID=UPI002168F135|nr:D-2-hydroxyacid dehydrogenase [Bradyrhizobium centrosematis]MCS3765675.1 phosphoglycerate dehydrogenase-like enzyme [Bradyrhizobium centrosematis]MCS3777901.1 phosphoglycerate dehydrogenase-like enzyme [Bradyrhizobium centrosematis]